MARTFNLKNISYTQGGRLNEGNSRIELNSSEQTNTLDIAVFVSDPEFFRDGRIVAYVNEVSNQSADVRLELTKIVSSSNSQAIYQGSLPLNDFKLKSTLIVLKTEFGPPNDTSVQQMATITGFVEEINLSVTLGRPGFDSTSDVVFWNAINKSALQFNTYKNFVDAVLCAPESRISRGRNLPPFDRDGIKSRSPFIQSEEYNIIKFATEYFMLKYFGIPDGQLEGYLINGKLPYFHLVSQAFEETVDIGDCLVRETERQKNPFLVELIWSYWMEQAMLVQTMNAVSLRFQNLFHLPYIKPLERLDIDPLRPLSHILWGYIQDEQHRLSLKRRVYEYDHEYGLNLIGKAIPHFAPVDSRVKFLEVFHDLLTSAVLFFREADDTTRIPDAFPVLNNLRETHLQLASGNHNAYGNLTWTARHEMMVQQYILARPEMKEFLGGKPMIAYNEAWMDRVETMRVIQGWGDTSIVNFYELAVSGEQLLLSIRLGNWNDINLTSDSAANWARSFRDRIQRYIHSYRVVTGVDLSEEAVDSRLKEKRYLQPSILIQKKVLGNSAIRRA